MRALRDRGAEMFRLYAGMNNAMDKICDGYTEGELALLVDFIRRTTDAGRTATDKLTSD